MRPIFVCGLPRTGTTMLYDTLCETGQFGFVSNWLNRFPRFDAITYLNRIHDIVGYDLMEYANKQRDRNRFAAYLPRPVEPWTYLNEVFPDFPIWIYLRHDESYTNAMKNYSSIYRNFQARHKIRRKFMALYKASHKRPMMVKYTDQTRFGFILDALPESNFIYIDRDFPPVALSNYKLQYEKHLDKDWTRWKHIYLSAMPKTWVDAFHSYNEDMLAFAAFQVKLSAKGNEKELKQYADRVLRVKYESLMADPINEFRRIGSFTESDIMPTIARKLSKGFFRSCNDKWRTNLSVEKQIMLSEIEQME